MDQAEGEDMEQPEGRDMDQAGEDSEQKVRKQTGSVDKAMARI